MSDTQVLEPAQTGKSIAIIVEENPAIVLLDAKSKDGLFNHIRSEIDAFEPDVSSAKGRAAIKSFAYKITQTKTAVDDAGKKLTEEWRAKTNAVNESRREVKAKLSEMAEAVRKPLTDWEVAEEKRAQECRDKIQWMRSAKNVFIEDTSENVRERGKAVYETELTPEQYGDLLAEAQAVKDETIQSLKASLARLVKEEEDRAELARLQQAEQERLAREAAEREAEEQRRREVEEARLAEERRIKTERLEAERIERAQQEAADRAKREAEEAAERDRLAEQQRIEAERAEEQRKHNEALEAERQRAQEAEQREAERIAREQQEEAERAAREADQEHRANVKNAARDALIATGASNALATKIVLAILAGDIPAVRLEF